MKKAIVISLAVLVLALAGWVADLLRSAGQFKTIAPHFDGACRQVEGLVGAEDITIHPQTATAFISVCDRRAVAAGRPGNGAIFAYDLNATAPEPVNLTPEAAADFQPHGIGLFVSGDGRDALFAVNHQGGRQQIELFDLVGGRLTHRKTISDPMLVSPNDVIPVGPEMFYATNDHRYVGGIKGAAEEYMRLRLSSVVFYDGNAFREAAGGIGYANGINIGADGRTVYVCAVTERSLHVYDRDPATHRLVHRAKLKLDTGVDNIEVDPAGALWIGAHPKLLSFVKHSKDPSALSPSQVLQLTPRSDGGFVVEEIYLNNGEELSGSSVAAFRGGRLLIGGVFDPHFLDCRMSQ